MNRPDDTYNVVLLDFEPREGAAARLMHALSMDRATAQQTVQQMPTILKRGLPQRQARAFASVVQQIGGKVRLEQVGGAPKRSAKPARTNRPSPSTTPQNPFMTNSPQREHSAPRSTSDPFVAFTEEPEHNPTPSADPFTMPAEPSRPIPRQNPNRRPSNPAKFEGGFSRPETHSRARKSDGAPSNARRPANSSQSSTHNNPEHFWGSIPMACVAPFLGINLLWMLVPTGIAAFSISLSFAPMIILFSPFIFLLYLGIQSSFFGHMVDSERGDMNLGANHHQQGESMYYRGFVFLALFLFAYAVPAFALSAENIDVDQMSSAEEKAMYFRALAFFFLPTTYVVMAMTVASITGKSASVFSVLTVFKAIVANIAPYMAVLALIYIPLIIPGFLDVEIFAKSDNPAFSRIVIMAFLPTYIVGVVGFLMGRLTGAYPKHFAPLANRMNLSA